MTSEHLHSNPIVTIDRLSKTYAGGFQALGEISLTIQRGELFALLGPNGAGKTTLISIICGIVNASTGSVRVGDFDIVADFRKARQMIGLVPQELHIDMFETVQDTVRFSRGLFGLPPNEAHIEKVLKDLSLWDKRKSKLMTLSGGMKRRVMIAKALAHEPELLFLDEPTSGLDPVSTRQVHDMVRRISQEGHTVFMCTHNLTEAQRLCHRVAVLEHGRMVAVGTPEELARQLGTGERVEIEVERAQIQAARAELRQLEGVQDVKLSDENNGARLIVSLDGRERIPQMLAHLVQQGVRVYRLSPLEASLEDIYFALHDDRQGRTTQQHANLEAVR